MESNVRFLVVFAATALAALALSAAGPQDGFTEQVYAHVVEKGAFPSFAVNGRVFQWLWGGPVSESPGKAAVDFTTATVDCGDAGAFDEAAERTAAAYANAYFVWRLDASDAKVLEKVAALEAKPYSRRIVGYCLPGLTKGVARLVRRELEGRQRRKLLGVRVEGAVAGDAGALDDLLASRTVDFVSFGGSVADGRIRSLQAQGVVPVLESAEWPRSLLWGLPLFSAAASSVGDGGFAARARCARCAGDWMLRSDAAEAVRESCDGAGGKVATNGKMLSYAPASTGLRRIRLPSGTRGAVDVFSAADIPVVDGELLLEASDLSPRLIYLSDGCDHAKTELFEAKNDRSTCGLPVVTRHVAPVSFLTNANGRAVVDFGKDAFGWLELLPPPAFTGGVCSAMIGESIWPGNVVNCWPAGSIRYEWCERAVLPATAGPVRVPFRANGRNTRYSKAVPPIKIPQQYGVVMPFRYVEFFDEPFPIRPENVRMVALNYPMDMAASSFRSSSPELDEVYEFCKYSIYATSFAGLYVDGDRERIPYEADAYINQLGHYAIDADCRMARATLGYLLDHPTGPTEWRQHAIMMAWADWMAGGDLASLGGFYPRLGQHGLFAGRVRADGLLSSPTDRLVFNYTDIIDWPPGDRDGFEFRPANAVANAFYYRNLTEMSEMAGALGRQEESARYLAMARRVKAAYREKFLSRDTGLFVDGEGSRHSSLHANAFAAAFGLAEEGEMPRVADYLASRGMVCSVYVAQYLLEALFKAGRADAAIRLMAARGKNSWLGMKEQGATMTMEAWDLADKHNLDWNHAWGAAPVNLIARYVLGVQPALPGSAKVSVRPQLGGLGSVCGVVPTARGGVSVEASGRRLKVSVPVPATVVWGGKCHEVPQGRYEFDGCEFDEQGK